MCIVPWKFYFDYMTVLKEAINTRRMNIVVLCAAFSGGSVAKNCPRYTITCDINNFPASFAQVAVDPDSDALCPTCLAKPYKLFSV